MVQLHVINCRTIKLALCINSAACFILSSINNDMDNQQNEALPENLPSILHPYLEKISATMLPTVTMQLTLSDELTLWQSKIGGQPYLPLDVSYQPMTMVIDWLYWRSLISLKSPIYRIFLIKVFYSFISLRMIYMG